MIYSLDTGILLHATNTSAPRHHTARQFLETCSKDTALLCLTWPVIMDYLRMATHPALFANPFPPSTAWENVEKLLRLPRVTVIGEGRGFAHTYREVSYSVHLRGNLVPAAYIACILWNNGVTRFYTDDSDYRKFGFLNVINPFQLAEPGPAQRT